MPHVYRLHNKPYTVFDEKDIFYIVDEECSPEISDLLRELISDLKEQADYTTQKVDTDLDSYEASLEEYSNAFGEIDDYLTKLNNYISDSKRLDRNEIMSIIGSIKIMFGKYI